jgi:hypothetical protein
MKKVILVVLSLLTISAVAQVQIHPLTNATVVGPIVTTIQEIQSVTGDRLASCDDKSVFHNLTVIVRGRMTMSGRTTFPQTTINGVVYPQTTTTTAVNQFGRDLAIQAGRGPFSGLIIRSSNCGEPLSGADLLDAVAGDSVQVLGIVEDASGPGFGGNTQINPLGFTILGFDVSNLPPTINGEQIEGFYPLTVNVGDLNGNTPQIINKLETGEKYENMFVELRDLTVVEFTSGSQVINQVNFGSETQRVRITCVDNQGNYVQIYDRFKAGRLPKNVQTSGTCGNSVVSNMGRLEGLPPIGGKFEYVRGILIHIKNQVPDQTCENLALNNGQPANDKGYQLEPFHPTHYKIAPYNPPLVKDIVLNPIAPRPNQPVTISATIESVDEGISIAGANVYYSFDTLNPLSWNSQPLSAVGNTWSGTIPNLGFEEGKLVYFYIKASDSRSPSLDVYVPAIPATINGVAIGREKPAFFVVRQNGLQIRDVQYTPFADGLSGYLNRHVTLTGVATSTVNDLGRVTIQQEGVNEWGGIFLSPSPFLNNVKRGDKITVSGKVTEVAAGASRFTTLSELTLTENVVPSATNVRINPIFLNFSVLSGSYNRNNHEKYEAMLATIINPVENGRLYVVDSMPDYPANFSEYRIGVDTTTMLTLGTLTGAVRNTTVAGTRILTGRTPAENSINSQRFPLVANPANVSTSAGANILPDTALIRLNGVNPIIANRKVSFSNITGIIQHSFGNMKLLPRDANDIVDLRVNGVLVPKTIAGVTSTPGVDATTSGSNLANYRDIYIYPNPTSGSILIKVLDGSTVIAKVTNLLGVEVLTPSIIVADGNINLSSLPKGIYLLHITEPESGERIVKRIILE